MEQKTCSKCKKCKDISEFYTKKRLSGKAVLYSQCKGCHSKYTKTHYVANKPAYLDRAKKAREAYQIKMRSFILAYLHDHPCVDCGERDVVVLQFDHCRGVKIMSISEMISRCLAERKVLAEIEKCDVRCANCHARKTARQFGWWHLELAPIA